MRIYADVMVIAGNQAFALEFKMKDERTDSEVEQAAKYAPYIGVLLGADVEVTPALVLTRAECVYSHVAAPDGANARVVFPDMLFNVFDEKMLFLG